MNRLPGQRGAGTVARLLSLCLLAAPGLSPAAGLPEMFDPADVVAGMHGTAHTVFQGSEPQPFAVELLGVLAGNSPKGELILFRALGDSLQRTGVVQGMSGSPVYVDGKLLGAIAFAFPFAKEPIGLITPIGEMLEGLERVEDPPGPWLGAPRATHTAWRESFLARSNDPELWEALAPNAAEASTSPTLLVLGAAGWAPEMQPILDRFARRSGLPAPVSAGAVAGGSRSPGPLRPGSAVAVQLIAGDASLAAIGTVTHVEGNRVLAFGHPLFQGGPVELPMSDAWIHAIVPSFNTSFKMGGAASIIGTVRQDLRSGITGIVGEMPALLPVRIVVEGPAGVATYRYELARGLLLEPNLLAWSAANSFLHRGWRIGEATIDASLTVHYNRGRLLRRQERITSRSPAGDIAQRLLLPIPLLLTNPFEEVELDSVVLEVSYLPELSETTVIGLSAGRLRVRPGETIPLTTRLADRHGEERELRIEIPVPERWAGRNLLILAGGVKAMTEWDRDRAPSVYEPRSLAGLERLIREFPREGELLVRVYSEEVGVVLGDRELGSLPASVARVLGTEQTRGPVRAAPNTRVAERRIDAGGSVTGGAAVRVRVE